jgi:two-component sensor histidine kinase
LPTRICLSCSHEETGGLRIAYEDDGVGFPEDFDVTASGHMGMSFIRLLSEGLGGHHEWHSDPLGIRFEITLPIDA